MEMIYSNHIPNTQIDRVEAALYRPLETQPLINFVIYITETQLSLVQEWIEMYYPSASGGARCGNDIKI